MEQYSVPHSKPAYCKAVIPVLAWIAVGLLSLSDIFRLFQIPFGAYRVMDLILGLLFPPIIVPAVLLAICFSLYRRSRKGRAMMGLGLGLLALSTFGESIEPLLFGSINIIGLLLHHALFAMLLISFISVCRGRTGKLFLLLSACAGILCVFSSAAAMPRSVGFVNYLRALPDSIPFWCNLFGSISLYLSLLLFGIHLPKAAPKEC